MTLNLQQLRDSLRKHIGVDEVEYDNPTVDLLLNRSWWEVMDTFEFKETEVKADWSTVVGQAEYTYTEVGTSLLEAIESLSVEDVNSGVRTRLSYMEPEDYQNVFVNRTDARAKPTHYTRIGTKIGIYPTPNAVYPMVTIAKTTLADIASGGVPIPKAWSEVILYGGVWRGFAELGDWNRKATAEATQIRLMNSKTPTEAKEKANIPMAGLQVIRNRYP